MAGCSVPQLQDPGGDCRAARIAVCCGQHQCAGTCLAQSAMRSTQIADSACKRQRLAGVNEDRAAVSREVNRPGRIYRLGHLQSAAGKA